jgi:hypothetical protein
MAEACSELDQASGSGSSIGDPMVSRTRGPLCAASHREGTLSDVRVKVEKGEFGQRILCLEL